MFFSKFYTNRTQSQLFFVPAVHYKQSKNDEKLSKTAISFIHLRRITPQRNP